MSTYMTNCVENAA